jgi:hypothetical protein
MVAFSKRRRNMLLFEVARATAFPETSIEEVEFVAFSELEQIDEQIALIESFRQPYPMRARCKRAMDGEMDSYG